jgi:hypothetical protein
VAEEDLVSSIFEQRIFPFFHFLDFWTTILLFFLSSFYFH